MWDDCVSCIVEWYKLDFNERASSYYSWGVYSKSPYDDSQSFVPGIINFEWKPEKVAGFEFVYRHHLPEKQKVAREIFLILEKFR